MSKQSIRQIRHSRCYRAVRRACFVPWGISVDSEASRWARGRASFSELQGKAFCGNTKYVSRVGWDPSTYDTLPNFCPLRKIGVDRAHDPLAI